MSSTVEFWQGTWQFRGTLVGISTGSASLADLQTSPWLHGSREVCKAHGFSSLPSRFAQFGVLANPRISFEYFYVWFQ